MSYPGNKAEPRIIDPDEDQEQMKRNFNQIDWSRSLTEDGKRITKRRADANS